jgi:iron(III) transport system substrate-binding protein
MRGWSGRIAVLVLFVALVLAPVVVRPRGEAAAVAAGEKLVVITPHNEQVRYEIERAFSRWHKAKFERGVGIDWRVIGGTSDIERQLMSEYGRAAEKGAIDEGVGYDVVFGGGDFFFDNTLKPGVGRKVSVLQKIDLGADFLRETFPEPTLAGKKLYDTDGTWYGVVVSTFGIVHNPQVLALIGAGEPRTWSDLAAPKMAGWVALADPSHSGSVRTTYESILQWYGFERGWATVRRIGANARYFASSAPKVPLDVSFGEAAAGMCIDSFGRFQAGVVGGERCVFVVPADAAVFTADPVAVLRGSPHRETAIAFVKFLLSLEGQAVWAYRRGEAMGPEKYELRRSPIRREMYRPESAAKMVDAQNPFELARPLPPNTPGYFAVIPTVLRAMAIDQHAELSAAWRTIRLERDPAKRAEMEAVFDELPFTPAELADAPKRWRTDPDAQESDRRRWTEFFAERYRRVALAGAR